MQFIFNGMLTDIIFIFMHTEEDIVTKTERNGNWFVIFIYGKFVVKNLTRIRMAFEEAEMYSLNTAIDLSNVTHLDSSAISLLANFQKRMQEKGCGSTVFGAAQDILEIFSIVGLDKVLSINTDKEYYDKIIQKKKS